MAYPSIAAGSSRPSGAPSSSQGDRVSQRIRTSWIDQYALREDVGNPFVQVITAAQQLAVVADDRSGLNRTEYDTVSGARTQAVLLEDLARWLDDEVAAHAQRSDNALADKLGPEERARVLAGALSGAMRCHSMLIDTCHTLLQISEKLLVVRRASSRLRLMAAVEAIRAAASTAHLTVLVNLPRITDAVLYDELAHRIHTFDGTLASANRVAASLRSEAAVRHTMPMQNRSVVS